jgi:hypothetical protein
MIDKEQFNEMWYPKGTILALLFLIVAASIEMGVHRIALFFHRPSHELAEIPYNFSFLVPIATYSVYLVELLSFFLLLFFSTHLLRIPIKSTIRRLTLGIIIFFSLPVLAVNGILIPTHSVGHLLWYYLCALTLGIVAGMSFWIHGAPNLKIKTLVFWYLLLSPSLFLLGARIVYPASIGFNTPDSWANLFIKIGNYLFIYQGLFWPILALRKKSGISLITLLFSFIPPIILAIWFRFDSAHAATIWYGGFRITLPLEFYGKFMFFVSMWASLYTIMRLITLSGWNRILGMGLILWLILGYSPYTEGEILPYILLLLVVLSSLVFSNQSKQKSYMPVKISDWSKIIGIKLSRKKSSKREETYGGKIRGTTVTITAKKSYFGRVSNYAISIGTIQDQDPDWVVTSLPYIPIGRHLFPSLPKVLSVAKVKVRNYGIWDRNFFSDTLISREINDELGKNLSGEIRVWWGSGLIYEVPCVCVPKKEAKKMGEIIKEMAENALIL